MGEISVVFPRFQRAIAVSRAKTCAVETYPLELAAATMR